jgi:hypothetical protein
LYCLALQSIYPEHLDLWLDYKVGFSMPSGYWKDIANQRAFFEKLAIKLNIQKPEDWYKVRGTTVFEEGGHFVKQFYGGSVIRGKFCCTQRTNLGSCTYYFS